MIKYSKTSNLKSGLVSRQYIHLVLRETHTLTSWVSFCHRHIASTPTPRKKVLNNSNYYIYIESERISVDINTKYRDCWHRGLDLYSCMYKGKWFWVLKRFLLSLPVPTPSRLYLVVFPVVTFSDNSTLTSLLFLSVRTPINPQDAISVGPVVLRSKPLFSLNCVYSWR